MKIGLLGLIALFVLSVSIPSDFAQSIESETDSPIKMILDMTLENLEESVLDPDREISSTAQTFYQMGQGEYQLAIDALNDGDIEAAEEHALIAMALFEDSASVIGELEESLVLGQLPPGFGSAGHVVQESTYGHTVSLDGFYLGLDSIRVHSTNPEIVIGENLDVGFVPITEHDNFVVSTNELKKRDGTIIDVETDSAISIVVDLPIELVGIHHNSEG